ncbi:MAG: tetratricopeptide repeat protein [Treponema sp.]|jgi:tetratricopeptide (TPR) repeat protein|nr:tetratricopeptide repeat protein [Treponema sp.]
MGKKKRLRYCIIAALLIFAGLATVCAKAVKDAASERIEPYYITGSRENRENLRDLFMLLDNGNGSAEDQFAVIREIANNYAKLREYGKLIHFLGVRSINYPGDPYNSYYLLMIAYAYLQQDSWPVAARYFDLIVKNYPDLTIKGESIHFACLNQLIELIDNPEQRVWYYQELISRFPEKIEPGKAWFMLGQSYERTGDWNKAIQAYARYLPYAGTPIPGFPNADNYAKQQVDFNNSPKDWTFESLPALLRAIQTALDEGNARQLRRCQAKVNFFARTWEQVETGDSGMADFNFSDFMQGKRIRYASKLDASSNATEAYLRTSGWALYISTWYLYFRKIYFPSNPEIHGRWEWAGLYYGEKL